MAYRFSLPLFEKDPSHPFEARAHTVIPPSDNSAWLVAGYYPTDKHQSGTIIAQLRLQAQKFGKVLKFVDLTEGENDTVPLKPYLEFIDSNNGESRFSHPLKDGKGEDDKGVHEATRTVLDLLMYPGNFVYVHCWGGHGRTGMVIARTLMLHYNMAFETAIYLNHVLHDTRYYSYRKGGEPKVKSPEHEEQEELIRRLSCIKDGRKRYLA